METLFTVSLLELFLGGGGRLIDIGPVTPRMILFIPCVLLGIASLFVRRRLSGAQVLAVGLAGAYLLTHLPGLIVGALHAANPEDMLREFQQSLFWLAAPFFAVMLQSPAMIRRAAGLSRFAGVALAVFYIGVLVGAILGEVDLFSLYLRVNESGEFVGRGEGMFFYKGFLYLGIAIVFLVALRGRLWLPLTLLVGGALVLTLTRGFMLSTTLAVLFLLLAQGRRAAFGAGLLATVVAGFLMLIYLPSINEGLSASRDISNNQRVEDTNYVAEHLSWATFVHGEGFGADINERANIENSFLWVFWKVGTAGVLFWLLPLVLCTAYFLRIPRKSSPLGCAFYFSVILVYVQTVTNPYLTNPIGLSFVIVALFSLRTLALQFESQPAPVPAETAVRRSGAPT